MRLASLEVSSLRIPFRTVFRHASAVRDTTQSIWVEAQSECGQLGHGEGCPREYVTAESLAGAQAVLGALAGDLCRSVNGIDTLRSWVDSHALEIDRNPAAWTAAECAILDLIGCSAGFGVEPVLGLPVLHGTFRYTAVIGDAEPEAFSAQLARYRKAGFSAFKIKLSGDVARDRSKVAALIGAGVPPASVRADANNLWPDADVAIQSIKDLDYPFWAIEEPICVGDYDGLLRLALALGTRVILDESLLRVSQLPMLGDLRKHCVANLRVSKMGGLLRSLELLQALRVLDIPVIVGAHVGESSLLTRAGLTVAFAAGDALCGQEGAFGTNLLQYDVAEPPLMFGYGGVLDLTASGMCGPGWGLNIIHQESNWHDEKG